jgi:hypothetical protein
VSTGLAGLLRRSTMDSESNGPDGPDGQQAWIAREDVDGTGMRVDGDDGEERVALAWWPNLNEPEVCLGEEALRDVLRRATERRETLLVTSAVVCRPRRRRRRT